ncbi:MAG: hypothetical protein AAFR27_07485 [Pseudomonadota bacterium]
MKKTFVLAGTAFLALGLMTPVVLAESTNQAPNAAVEKVERFAAPFEATCTLSEASTNVACNDNAPKGKSLYPSAPTFPQFGI